MMDGAPVRTGAPIPSTAGRPSLAQVEAVADLLQSAARERQTIVPITELLPELDIDDAYRIQQEGTRRAHLAGATLVGRKIGLTSAAMQHRPGVDEPGHGALSDRMLIRPGDPAPGWLLQPRIEATVAFVLERAVPEHADVTDVLEATRAVHPAIEVSDSRIRDWRLTLVDTIADNASSGAFVLGPACPVPPDLARTEVVLFRDTEQVASGTGRAALGHPAAGVAWLARALARHGQSLRAGDVVLSGALHSAVPAAPGDTFRAVFSDLGDTAVTFTTSPEAA
jgi:2-keto-4-pentenoate hydratase